jgi:hypothetical protein
MRELSQTSIASSNQPLAHGAHNSSSAEIKALKKSRPISRILSFLRTDHHPSRSVIAYRFKQPTRWLERAVLKRHLRGLASGGVYQAICITTNTGGLLHHRFTLTHLHVRSIFCGTNPADFSGWALPTTLLSEVRTFLGVLLQRGDPGDSSAANNTPAFQ